MNELELRRKRMQIQQMEINIEKLEIAILEEEENIELYTKNRREAQANHRNSINGQKSMLQKLRQEVETNGS